MKKSFSDPKGFGEILDHTFHLSKTRFKGLAMIFIILIGPIILLEAFTEFLFGMSLIREMGPGSNWIERMMASFEEDEMAAGYAPLGLIGLFNLATLLLLPIAQAAVLCAVNRIRQGDSFTPGSAIGEAFSRFWPIIGSNILFGLIIFGVIFIPLVVLLIVFIPMGGGGLGAVFMALILLLGAGIGIGLFMTRISFFFGSVVLDKEAPGFGNSWNLTKDRTWILFGLYVVLFLIVGAVSLAVEGTFAAMLGNSVLLFLINNLVLMVTYIIFTVGYAVIFFDLKVRYYGDDLRDMLDDYKKENEPDSTL